VLTFQDNGPGIPAEIADRLFQSFVTAGKKNGTGLGLAIVKHVCANHGGRVSVWSQEGRGSTFTMTLPAAADRPSAVEHDDGRTWPESHEERALHDAHPDR